MLLLILPFKGIFLPCTPSQNFPPTCSSGSRICLKNSLSQKLKPFSTFLIPHKSHHQMIKGRYSTFTEIKESNTKQGIWQGMWQIERGRRGWIHQLRVGKASTIKQNRGVQTAPEPNSTTLVTTPFPEKVNYTAIICL